MRLRYALTNSSDVNVPSANAAFTSAIVAVSMFSPAARAGTYKAPTSAHNATTEYSTRFMRIAISSPAISDEVHRSWRRLAQSNGCARPSGPLTTGRYRDDIVQGEARKGHRRRSAGGACDA